MAQFEAYFYVMKVGTFNFRIVDMKMFTRTTKTEANGKFGKENIQKTNIVLDKTFFGILL